MKMLFQLMLLLTLGLINNPAHAVLATEPDAGKNLPGSEDALPSSSSVTSSPTSGSTAPATASTSTTASTTNSQCISEGNTISTTANSTQVCCAGLKVKDSKCEKDNSPVDTSLVDCGSNPAICTDGKGCFPQSIDDQFTQLPGSESELASQEQTVDQLDSDDAKPNGALCFENRECQSYACQPVNGSVLAVCVEKKICRLANTEDINVASNVQCEEGLRKNGSVCVEEGTEDSGNSGLLSMDASLDGISPEEQRKGQVAIETSRSLEWIMKNLNPANDCMKLNPYIRNRMATIALNRRLEALKELNRKLAQLELDQQTLLLAQENKNIMVSMHGNQMTSYDLATRRISGADALYLMIRKNNAYNEYEETLKEINDGLFQQVTAMKQEMDHWGRGYTKDWTLGARGHRYSTNGSSYGWNTGTYRCRGGGFLNLGRRKIFKRWNQRSWAYRPDNLLMVTQGGVAEKLKLVYPNQNTHFRSMFSSGSIYMIDPIYKPSDVGISDFKNMRKKIRNQIIDYYKTIKTTNASINASFLYEPELMKVSLQNFGEAVSGQEGSVKDCINLAETTPGCEDYVKMIDSITDTTMASYIGWSYQGRDTYKYYFTKADTRRRGLVKFWETQLANATEYYKKKILIRERQNAKYNTAIAGLVGLQADASGLGTGVKNYFEGTPESDTSTGSLATSAPGQAIRGGDYKFGLPLKANTVSGQSLKDDLLAGKDASASGNMASGSNSSAISRVKQLLDRNQALQSKGANIENVEKAYNDALASVKTSSGSSLSSAASTPSSSSNTPMPSASTSTDDSKNKGKKDASIAAFPDVPVGGMGNPAIPMPNLGTAGSIDSSGKDYQDPTGMSDEEKSVIMANIDRNRSKYSRQDEDDLFTIISKQYANSLDRILTRKKAGQE